MKGRCVGLQLKKRTEIKTFLKGTLTYTYVTMRSGLRHNMLAMFTYFTYEFLRTGCTSLFKVVCQ